MLNTDTKGHMLENFADMEREYSPSLPEKFPQSLIPQGDLCKHSFAQLLLCTMNSAQNLCGAQAKKFYVCKRERDAQLFTAIKDWEISDYSSMEDKGTYIQELETTYEAKVKELSTIKESIGNKHKRWRYEADITQLEWRI